MINQSSQKIFNNSLLYSVGMIFSKAVGFFLVPIYTFCVSPDEYGVATTITTFVSTFGIVVSLSLRAAMIRFYNQYNDQQKPVFIGTIVSFVILNAIVICSLLCLLNRLYVPLAFEGIGFFPYVFLGICSLGFESIYLLYQSLLQAKQDGKSYSINSIVYLLFHAVAVVLFVMLLNMGGLGIVLSNLVTNVCFAIYGLCSMKSHGYMKFGLDRVMLRNSLKYSIPILPHNLATNLNAYSTKTIINRYLGYAVSGIYALASQFSTIFALVQSSVNLAFRPWFVEQMQSGEEGRKQIKHMSCMIMALFSFCAVGISLFSKELVVLLSEQSYTDAWKMIPFFILTQLVAFIYFSHVQTLMYNLKKSKYTFICSSSSVIVNIAVSLCLVGRLGVYAILIAQFASQVTMAFLAVIMGNRAEKVDFGLRKMLVFIVAAAMLAGAGVCIDHCYHAKVSIFAIVAKVFILGIGFAVLILPYKKDFVELLQGLVQKRKKEDNGNA